MRTVRASGPFASTSPNGSDARCTRPNLPASLAPLEALAILAAGVAAGTINAVVGSGTLITFPVLIALGYEPVTANVSNNIGLVPGAIAGSVGYRRELRGQEQRVRSLGGFSAAGAACGAAALLLLPASSFEAIVPVFIAVAIALVAFQPQLTARLEHRHREGAEGRTTLRAAVFVAGIYGGYFGAAQGIILISLLSLALREHMQRANALKNVLAMLVNLVAGIVFVIAANVDWRVAGLIAAGSVVGGWLGARYGRRLPPDALRALIVVVGLAAIVRLTVL